jgi:hypothetical protein
MMRLACLSLSFKPEFAAKQGENGGSSYLWSSLSKYTRRSARMSIIFRPEVVASSFSNASARAAKGVRTILVQGSRCRRAATNLPGDEPWAAPLAWARKLGLANIEEVLIKHGAT